MPIIYTMPLRDALVCEPQQSPYGAGFLALANERRVDPALTQATWELHIQNRSKRAGRDWVVESGICVTDQYGVNQPLHFYLLEQIRAFARALSSQAERDQRALNALWERSLKDVEAVINSCVDFPDEHWAYTTCPMLLGNFADTMLALLDIALGNGDDEEYEEGQPPKPIVLQIDAITLGVVSPAYYSKIKGEPGIKGAIPLRQRFALVCAPNSSIAGDDGIAPRAFWAVQNALNFEFGTPPQSAKNTDDKVKASLEKKASIKEWDAALTARFRSECLFGDVDAGFVTPDELDAYLRQTWG